MEIKNCVSTSQNYQNQSDVIVTAPLRGMRPAPSSKKDTPMLRKTQTLTLLIELLTIYY